MVPEVGGSHPRASRKGRPSRGRKSADLAAGRKALSRHAFRGRRLALSGDRFRAPVKPARCSGIEPYGEGIATHTGPESCISVGDRAREALTGERAGRPSSRERSFPQQRAVRGADAVEAGGRQNWCVPRSRGATGPPAVRDPAHARKHLAREPGDPTVVCGTECRRPHREPEGIRPVMNGRGKSDSLVVPRKPPNKAKRPRRRWREGDWPRGIRPSKMRPGLCAGQARQVSSNGYEGCPSGHVAVMTRGRSPVRKFRTPGSGEGTVGDHGPYSNTLDMNSRHTVRVSIRENHRH